jgi:hypothetical protein
MAKPGDSREAIGQINENEGGINPGDIVNYHLYKANGVVVDVKLQRRYAFWNPSEPAPNIGVDYGAGRISAFYENELKKVGEYDSTAPNADPTKCGKDMGSLCCRYLVKDADGGYFCGRFLRSTNAGLASHSDKRMPVGLYPDCQIEPIESYAPSFRASYDSLNVINETIARAKAKKIEEIDLVRTKVSKIPDGALVTVKAAEGKSVITHLKLPPEADRNYGDVKIRGDESFTGIFEVHRDVSNPDSTPFYEIRNEQGYVWLYAIEPHTSKDPSFVITDVRQPE